MSALLESPLHKSHLQKRDKKIRDGQIIFLAYSRDLGVCEAQGRPSLVSEGAYGRVS